MKHLRERVLMAAILVGLPTLILVLGILPTLKRSKELRQQIQAVNEDYKTLPPFMPLSRVEREALADPKATWRSRLPMVTSDKARLAHYHRVVGDLQGTLKAAGVPSRGMRSSWDPIKASFSVPGEMGADPHTLALFQDSPDSQVNGWVLEAEIPGPTSHLFRSMAAIHRVGPILEPVGLRWEAGLDFRQQKLLLRNLVLTP
ncbi:MAG: hypothetical protein WAT51_00540 [Holophaga sp.]